MKRGASQLGTAHWIGMAQGLEQTKPNTRHMHTRARILTIFDRHICICRLEYSDVRFCQYNSNWIITVLLSDMTI